MLKWIKKLFNKQKNDIIFYEFSVQNHLIHRYNVRDTKGRFTKVKGKKK